ncbi:Hypothetical predicted protein [Olea europaea subsp. europaea]|uniref:Uncharacterized protein n=1 Tax=Olea europaea subsp. europaea TaxID=158383 RepID=A0A8S0TKP1_OLEEU|nr:Hypothetical predicted protein [Olea europaea subsp. europaea]
MSGGGARRGPNPLLARRGITRARRAAQLPGKKIESHSRKRLHIRPPIATCGGVPGAAGPSAGAQVAARVAHLHAALARGQLRPLGTLARGTQRARVWPAPV